MNFPLKWCIILLEIPLQKPHWRVQKTILIPFNAVYTERPNGWRGLRSFWLCLPALMTPKINLPASPHLRARLLLEAWKPSIWCPDNLLFGALVCRAHMANAILSDASEDKTAFCWDMERLCRKRRQTLSHGKPLEPQWVTISGTLKPPRAGDVDQFQHILEHAAKTSLITFLNPELM